MSRLPADDPSHRGIMAKSVGIVDILVSRKAAEHRLPQHAEQGMPAIFARACVGQHLAGQSRQAQRVVEFAIGKQTGIGGHDRTAKLEHQSAVEIEPERPAVRFTRRVRHDISFQISLTC